MDTLVTLYNKYITALSESAVYMCDNLPITAWEIQMFYDEAVFANQKSDFVWRDQVLEWTGEHIYTHDL